MFSLNRATIIGNATRDPELRSTPNGHSVAGFAVATNRRWTDRESGEMKEEVQFHEIVVWGKMAETAAQYIHKGNKVYIEGRLQTRTWEGQDGARREKTEIVAENFIFLTPKGAASSDSVSSDSHGEPQTQAKSDEAPKKVEKQEKPDGDEINLDEIPF
jgi:single-strand DNA-binding protein